MHVACFLKTTDIMKTRKDKFDVNNLRGIILGSQVGILCQ